MGCLLEKPEISDDDLRDFSSTSEQSSCGLTEYWNSKQKDFHHIYFNRNNRNRSLAKASDFQMSTLLDKGAYGSVTLTTHNKTGIVYATKVIAKRKIVKNSLVSFFKLMTYKKQGGRDFLLKP